MIAKIIIRARKRYLFDEYLKKPRELSALVADVNEAYALIEKKAQEEADKDKKEMYSKMLAKVKSTIDERAVGKNGSVEDAFRAELLDVAAEMIMTWLDKHHGKEITDNSIFSSLPRHYESEFHKDMSALNVSIKNKQNSKKITNVVIIMIATIFDLFLIWSNC